MSSLDPGLFIDESGDFETERGEWLIAGLLCRGPMLEIQSSLSKAFSKQVDADVLPPLAQCHLTEYRRANGVREANSIAERVFSTVFSECADLHPLLAIAVNTDKRRAGTGLRVSELLALRWGDVDFENACHFGCNCCLQFHRAKPHTTTKRSAVHFV